MQQLLRPQNETQEFVQQVQYCDPNQVVFEKRPDGHYLNIRGQIRDTSGLQASIVEAGNQILKPVELKIVNGELTCIDGHRRTIVARKLDIPLPYILVNLVGELDTLDHMLISNVRQNFPYLILDKEGLIIGGLAYAIHQKLQQGKTTIQIARMMGYKTDRTVKLLVDLFKADTHVRKAVAKGNMSLKAFETIRHVPHSKQTAVLAEIESRVDEGAEVKFTKDNLRRAAKKQKSQSQPNLVMSDEQTVIQKLNNVKNQLQTLLMVHTPLGPMEKEILYQIKELTNV